MDSEESNSNERLPDPVVKIKVEPSTSMSIAATSIKTEIVNPTPTTRLTSFRVPRDLTLGGHVKLEKPKKLYTPNLNVQRNKTKDDHTAPKNNIRNSKERGRGRGHNSRGRGRGKTADNIIQTDGVFSSGIADSDRTGRKQRIARESGGGNRSSEGSSSSALEKPKLNLNYKIDKAEEEEKLKNLLRDDFIENGAVPDMENAPVMLPMADEARLYKEALKDEPGVGKVDDLDEEVKPLILENGKDVDPGVMAPPLIKSEKNEKKLITIPQIVANDTNSYILIQFPDCLPGLRTDDELSDPKSKKASESNAENPVDNNPKTEYCTINSLKEGMIGKLQILKSGQARLVLGDNKLVVDVGSHVSFRQDLIAAKLDVEKLTGELVNLGRVGSTLICSPDWESMLANL